MAKAPISREEEKFMREIVIGAAQMGAIKKADSREAVVSRMFVLLNEAIAAGCTLVVFPELCLTTFFPRWYMEDTAEVDTWFEFEMPNAVTQPLFNRARAANVAISLGYAEKTPEGKNFNSQILTDQAMNIIGKYRKVHLPGHSEFDANRYFQHLEKRYFEPGDLGFPVFRNMDTWMGMLICNDRRWPEAYRELGLQGVELIMLGYNTPTSNSQNSQEQPKMREFHSNLSCQAGAYQNSAWVVAVAKAGDEDGHPLLAGSIIVAPDGTIVEKAQTDRDELLLHACDMDATKFGKTTVFDFKRHRRIEHYSRVASQTGVIYPNGTKG
jgi:predicted amidohydrolase